MTLIQRNHHRSSPVTPERPKVSIPFANMNRLLPSHSEDSQDNNTVVVEDALHLHPNHRDSFLLELPPILTKSNSTSSQSKDENANTQPILTQRDRPTLIIAGMWAFFIVWIFCLNGFNFLGADNNPHDNHKKDGHNDNKTYDPEDWDKIQAGHVFKIVDTSTNKVQKAFLIQVVPKMEQQNDENGVTILEHAGPHAVRVSVLDNTAAPGDNHDMLPQEPPMIRLVGEAILPIPLVPTAQSSKGQTQKQQWTGKFTLPPINGMYYLDSDYDTTTPTIWPTTYAVRHSKETTPFQVRSSDTWASALVPLLNRHGSPTWSSSMSLFPSNDHYWIHAPQIHGFSLASDNNEKDSLSKQKYVWANAQTQLVTSRSNNNAANAADGTSNGRWTSANTRGKTSETSSQVSLSSTIRASHESWFQSFNQLSNYEIVCWIGGRSAELASQVFLSLRQDLFPAQRPFKFHYHPILESLEHPDITWNEEWQGKFRKCKHVLVLLDDDIFMEEQQQPKASSAAKANGMAAEDYRSKLVTFMLHLTKAFPDPTFPIWVFTIALETPLRARQRNHCYNKKKHDNNNNANDDDYSHSLDHPCNLVIYDIFAHKAHLFDTKDQSRIRLLNNTDLSMAMMPGTTATSITSTTTSTTTTTTMATSTNHNHFPRVVDLMGMIALRTYVIVGKQVEEWRSHGQVGKIDGLHRNGTIEPNFDLLPYKWN